jgi:S1-C subfamily serine protease
MVLLAVCVTVFATEWAAAALPQEPEAPSAAVAELAECALEQLESRLTNLYQTLRPSLVGVRMTVEVDGLKPQIRTSSGVVLDDWGLVIAPIALPRGIDFVVHDIRIQRMDDRSFEAEVLEHSTVYNLSLLRAPELLGLGPKIGRGRLMEEGAVTIAMGNSYGLPGNVSMGFLSGGNRRIAAATHLMQVTNPINHGDRGGILANRRGELVGVQLTSLAGAAHGLLNGEWGDVDLEAPGVQELLEIQKDAVGVSFAVPIEIIIELFPEYLGQLLPPRRVLGVEVSPVLEVIEDPDGTPGHCLCLLVHGVAKGSPAALAGVQTGDILVAVGGQEVGSLPRLGSAIQKAAPHSTLSVLRDGKPLELPIEFAPVASTDG